MSGIVGFTGIDTDLLTRMLESMAHRGPDDIGIESNGHFSLGFCCPAGTEHKRARQPLTSEDRRLTLLYNGEIYNADQLRTELSGAGHQLAADSADVELILRGYQEWGQDVVTHLTGIFALALWDSTRGELFLARDRLGVKPLYYAQHDNRFVFASEIKAILQDPALPRRENRNVLRRFLLSGERGSGGDTFFEGVKFLRPGHVMTVGDEGIVGTRRYWNPEVNLEFSSTRADDDWAAEFAALHDAVVARHLVGDAPIGAALDAGLPSAGVACTVAELVDNGADLHTGGRLHTFTALVGGEGSDEAQRILDTEQSTGCVAHHVQPTVDDFWSDMKEWIWFQEEPSDNAAAYTSFCVYRLARADLRCLVTGLGGDQLLGADPTYQRTYVSSVREQGRWGAGARHLLSGAEVYAGLAAGALRARRSRQRSGAEALRLLDPVDTAAERTPAVPERNLNARLAHDLLTRRVPVLLCDAERNSAAFSIEVRVPLLDHQLVEYVLKLPIDQKIDRGWDGVIYRRALRGRLPRWARRQGSAEKRRGPEEAWIRGRAARMRAIFDSPICRGRAIYDNDRLLAAFDAWLGGAAADPLVFWRTMVTELWMQRYLDQPVGVAA